MTAAVLLLNASYEPLRIIPLSRALSLLMKERVDVVESDAAHPLRSPSIALPRPSVLRLRRYVNVPRRHATWTRRGVLARDRYACAYCGLAMRPKDATIDHVVPQSTCARTGVRANTWTNTVASCLACQKRKGDKSMAQAGMRFFDPQYEPKTPRTDYLVLTSEIAPEWRKYIRL